MSLAKQALLADVRHSAWATRNLLEGCSALTAEELSRDFRISHASILATLQHTCDGERVWLLCLRTADLGTWRLPMEPGPALMSPPETDQVTAAAFPLARVAVHTVTWLGPSPAVKVTVPEGVPGPLAGATEAE